MLTVYYQSCCRSVDSSEVREAEVVSTVNGSISVYVARKD